MPSSKARLRILHVDDDDVNRLVLDQMLQAFGHETVAATSAREAAEALRGGGFDLVMTDIHMPDASGDDLLAAVREGSAGDPSIPVIAVSADLLTRRPDSYRIHGFAGFIAKPVTFANLESAIDEVLFGPEQTTWSLAKQRAAAYARAARGR